MGHPTSLREALRASIAEHDSFSLAVTSEDPGYYCHCVCGERLYLPDDWRPPYVDEAIWAEMSTEERKEASDTAPSDQKLVEMNIVYLDHRIQALLNVPGVVARRPSACTAPDGHTCTSEPYWCPTSNSVESACHGGFSVCCEHPELHEPAFNAYRESSA